MSSSRGVVIRGLSHAFGDFVAARDVDLEVACGEVHCLLGPSGSGKSTLLRLVAGLEILQTGSVEIAGRRVAGSNRHVPPEQRSVGFVFQDYALFPHLDVRHNVMFGMAKASEPEKRSAADELLERVEMASHASAMPHTLSGGQQQRVALARALAREPSVMLLDEPFSGLDTQLRDGVREKTLEVLKAAGVATLMVTHDPPEALVAGDLISVISEGRILQTASPGEIYDRPISRRVAEVFGPVNHWRGVVRQSFVESPLGKLPVTGLADGSAVEILVRPESVCLSALRIGMKPAATATIKSLVLEGGVVRLTLELADGTVVQARDLARRGWETSEEVGIEVATQAVIRPAS